ncbi:MAG: hypothetical protein HC888_03840 [Candidatus Competibacteraceae bacterium]|nr:hypothetical protein [Candidatus Competibacteraceae bacterium]
MVPANPVCPFALDFAPGLLHLLTRRNTLTLPSLRRDGVDHWTPTHHALNHSLHHVDRIMCLRSKSHVEVARAGEVVQQAGGLHVLEFHGPTAGALGAWSS